MGAVGRRAPAAIRNNASSRKETLVHGKAWHWERSSSAAESPPHRLLPHPHPHTAPNGNDHKERNETKGKKRSVSQSAAARTRGRAAHRTLIQ